MERAPRDLIQQGFSWTARVPRDSLNPVCGNQTPGFPASGTAARIVVAPGPVAEALHQQPEEGLCLVAFLALVETSRVLLGPFAFVRPHHHIEHRTVHHAPRRSPSPGVQSENLFLEAWEAHVVRLIELSVPE